MTEKELRKEIGNISSTRSGVVSYDYDNLVSLNGQFTVEDLRQVIDLVQRYLNSQQPKEIEEISYE
jgi:hypothetical protein